MMLMVAESEMTAAIGAFQARLAHLIVRIIVGGRVTGYCLQPEW